MRTPISFAHLMKRGSLAVLSERHRFQVVFILCVVAVFLIVTLQGRTAPPPPSQVEKVLIRTSKPYQNMVARVEAAGGRVTNELTSGGTFVVNNPETGLIRVTVMGNWTNAGTISGDVSIQSVKDAVPGFTTQGEIADRDFLVFQINVPAGTSTADFRLIWRDDWSNLPVSDLDMILFRPDGTVDISGAKLNDPERAAVNNPSAGTWFVLIDGFYNPAGTDRYELRVALDGKVIKF